MADEKKEAPGGGPPPGLSAFEMFEGMLFPVGPAQVPLDKQIHDLRNLDLRDDDLFLVAYPKTGTHWIWEVMSMLLRGNTKYDTRTKEFMMMEFTPKERLDAEPSPRIFNTHVPFSMVNARGIKEKNIKVVHVYRNPKDVAVSLHYHVKQMPGMMNATMDMTVDKYVNGPCLYGFYSDFLRQVETFMADNPDVQLLNVSYEETKKDPVATVERLAAFLGVSASPDFCQEVADACSFQKMKVADDEKQQIELPPVMAEAIGSDKLSFYRKGEVGDWKNHLTVSNNEMIDKFIAEKFKDLSQFSLQYQL